MVTPHHIPPVGTGESQGGVPLTRERQTPSTDDWVFGVREPPRWGIWDRVLDVWDRLASSWVPETGGELRSYKTGLVPRGLSPKQRARSEAIISLDPTQKKARKKERAVQLDQSYVKTPAPWADAKPAPTLDVEELRRFLVDALNDELRHVNDPHNRMFVERLIRSVGSKLSFPPFPDVARQLDTILRQGDPPMARVVELVERDPSLVGSVWTKARGAAYLMPPTSLSLAIARIGFDSLWRIGMEICMYSGVFRVRGYQDLADDIRMHGIVTAEVASWMNNEQSGPIYLAGLLHDVGKLVLLRNVSSREADGLPSSAFIDHLFRAYHSSFSVLLARSWNLGDSVAGMVGYHHAPDQAPESLQRSALILNVADVVTHTADHYRNGKDCGGMLKLLDMDQIPFNPARCISKAQEVFARIDAEERDRLGSNRLSRPA